MKYEFDEKSLRDEVDTLTIEELKEFAYKALRAKELNRLRKQQERRLAKERSSKHEEKNI
ncbi:hypothetical protein PN398_08035 [Romboutsia sp. 1001216sp1]|uniref:hypothetical protein n=1 Tax=unclassified Romboutsia TaxID=2626894 RepID=UPI00189CCA4E|nr:MULTISPECIES: hypothetical protein [unclassified Romboutsia]MDB8790668.1 hypothetical protein [Romboutsia sp. 1001216sp1]MDB8803231.1 hypothetical protein [Romboutsia sp. 1001216sp1]MDB8814605.1 hypothetical protein [Romboutsia sp. 1001216sp1]